jgi:hypothetical protein
MELISPASTSALLAASIADCRWTHAPAVTEAIWYRKTSRGRRDFDGRMQAFEQACATRILQTGSAGRRKPAASRIRYCLVSTLRIASSKWHGIAIATNRLEIMSLVA